MTLIADAKSRLTFGAVIKPGQVFQVESVSPDEFRVVRLAKPARKAPPVAKKRLDPRKFRGIDLDEPAFKSW